MTRSWSEVRTAMALDPEAVTAARRELDRQEAQRVYRRDELIGVHPHDYLPDLSPEALETVGRLLAQARDDRALRELRGL